MRIRIHSTSFIPPFLCVLKSCDWLQSHILNQVAAIDLVREMMISTGEEVEVRKYKRLTELIIEVTF
jgi:hypothetical protein